MSNWSADSNLIPNEADTCVSAPHVQKLRLVQPSRGNHKNDEYAFEQEVEYSGCPIVGKNKMEVFLEN